MKKQSRKTPLVLNISVSPVSQNRVANRIEVDPDLMSPAGKWKHVQNRVIPDCVGYAIPRRTRLPPFHIYSHSSRAELAYWTIDAIIFEGRNSVYQRTVFLRHCSLFKLPAQDLVAFWCFGENDYSADIFVQAMNNKKPLSDYFLSKREKVLDGLVAFGYRRKSGRLIECNVVGITE